jgi:hypothetical protein
MGHNRLVRLVSTSSPRSPGTDVPSGVIHDTHNHLIGTDVKAGAGLALKADTQRLDRLVGAEHGDAELALDALTIRLDMASAP